MTSLSCLRGNLRNHDVQVPIHHRVDPYCFNIANQLDPLHGNQLLQSDAGDLGSERPLLLPEVCARARLNVHEVI